VLNYALINHQNLQAIRSPFFGKKVAAKPLLGRIKSDPGALPDSPTSMNTKWCQYREPNRSLNTANLKTDLRKLMETDGMSFSEEARKITNKLMCSNRLSDSLSWTASDNSSFEDLQNTKPPTFSDTDISDLETELAAMKIPMLDEIKQIEAQQKLEEDKENDKRSLLSSYNTLKHNAEMQQLQLEQETVDSAMKTQTMVDVRRFKEILLKHKTSELSKSELLEEIEKAFEMEVGPPIKPQRQLTFDVVDTDEDEDTTICDKTVLERTVVEADQTGDLEAKFQQQMAELFQTFSKLNGCSTETPQLNLDLSTILPGTSRRKSVISSTPNVPSVVRPSRLSVNPTARGQTISPMLKKHARMTIKPTIQRPQTGVVASRPLKLKTSPIRALAPTKRAHPPMIAVHPVPRSRSSTCTPALDSSTVGTPAGGKRVSYAMTPKANRTALPDNGGGAGGRRRSLTAGATPKVVQIKPGVGTPARKLGVPQAGNLQTTPSKMPHTMIGTPASRKSVLAAPQSHATPSRRSLLPSQSGPRNLMNQMTPRPVSFSDFRRFSYKIWRLILRLGSLYKNRLLTGDFFIMIENFQCFDAFLFFQIRKLGASTVPKNQ
jgi:hypothetical protein